MRGVNVRKIALGLGLLLAVTACGSGSDPGAAAPAETRTITGTMNGDVTGVPVHPKRIVALWRTGSELADLGVVPVAALEGEFQESELSPAAYAKVKDVPVVGSFEGVSVEKVISAKPDLIIGMDNGGLKIDYKELSAVAPTVILKIAEPTDVWDNYPKIADLVGLATDYQQKQAALDTKLAAIATQYGSTIKPAKAVVLGTSEGAIYVDTSKSLTWRRLDKAGFGYLDAYATSPKRYVVELSAENLPSLAGADVIFYDADLTGKPTEGTDKLLEMPSFKRLPAVVAGNLFPLTQGVIYTFDAAEKQAADLAAAAAKVKPVTR